MITVAFISFNAKLFNMQNFTFKTSLKRKLSQTAMLSFFLLLISYAGQSQRNYSLLYSENLKGGTTIFGNTLMHIIKNGSVDLTKMNGVDSDENNSYSNDSQNMQFIDIDGSSGNGSVTINSSSADLILPAGTNTIKLARIYWGGAIKNTDYDLTLDANKKIKIRKGTSSVYSEVVASGIDKMSIDSRYTEYQAYADITSYVKSNGGGTYTVGNIPLSTGSSVTYGAHGGWSIVIVYENTALNYNSVRLYDGFQKVYNSGAATTTTVVLNGLDVPSGALSSAEIGRAHV